MTQPKFGIKNQASAMGVIQPEPGDCADDDDPVMREMQCRHQRWLNPE
jgi:hypothetical protein